MRPVLLRSYFSMSQEPFAPIGKALVGRAVEKALGKGSLHT